MSDLESDNLIDLSLEVEFSATPPSMLKTEYESDPSSESLTQRLHFVSPPSKKRESLDNNPFDCVQKMANNRQDDPFDILEKEATFKGRHLGLQPAEVKLGTLLALDDENTLEQEHKQCMRKSKGFDLDSESPPVNLMDKILAPDSSGPDSDSNPNSSAELSVSSKLKRTMEYRKRLLKLSVTNAAFNSPVSRRSSLEDSDTPSTPVTALLSKVSQYGENMLSSESPLKFVDDDIMSEEPPSLLDDEKEFEADLEMMTIPMLSELQSPAGEDTLLSIEERLVDSLNHKDVPSNALANLEAIRAKLKAKREEDNNNHQQDIKSLICDLKSLIVSGDQMDNGKKMQASTILESLSTALSASSSHKSPTEEQNHLVLPQPIKRQGTFDMELRENEEGGDLNKQPYVHEMPNCMVSSSATYDGETVEEKQDFVLPEIDPPSPLDNAPAETTLQSGVNDIMEQLSKLLIHNNSGDGAQNGAAHNPTFIVVMNTTPMPQNNSISVIAPTAKQSSVIVSSFLENSIDDGSPDLNKSNKVFARRRSQSLSIHDKIQIVQMPLQSPLPKGVPRQYSISVDDSPPVTNTPPLDDMDAPEFKTPARRVRRNSYSSGTQYATAAGLRKAGFSSDGKSTTHVRRTPTLDTHHEGQQQKAIVRPMTMPANNLPSFKPDLKKKVKSNNTASIMKSSGPLKATIPVKKVAPMIKVSPPTSGHDSPTDIGHNTSLHRTNKIPTTPMSSSRSSKVSVGPGYPNACSTPSILTSPMKRSGLGITKPRYSNVSAATPNLKPAVSATASSILKRRTISEFKVKSPLKSRQSSGSFAAATTTTASTSRSTLGASSRLSTSAGAKIPCKGATKTTANTATVRPTGRLGSSSRLSGVGSHLTTRNKENKHP